MHTMIHIKAEQVIDNQNGTFSIEIPVEPLTPEQDRMLDKLFPTTGTVIYRLLSQEALFKAIATLAEVEAPKDNDLLTPKKAKTH